MIRLRIVALLVVGVWTAVDARAGLFDELYRGLDILATPSGTPLFASPDGGFGNGQRQGRLRIVRDGPGRGYTMEFDRTFGVDTRGRPEVLDLGAYELELNGTTQATAGYTNRGYLVGNVDLTTNNMNYRLSDKTGLQDYELTGTFNLAQSMEVNQFGFYTLNMNVSNANSTLSLDGAIIRNTQDMAFDVGPIAVEGNIYFDALIAILASVGVDTTALEELTPKSGIDRVAAELQAQFDTIANVAGVSMTADGETVLLTDSARNRPALSVGPQPLVVEDSSAVSGEVSFVPEPGTLMLVALGGVLFGATRRHR